VTPEAEVIALVLTAVVHMIGAVVLVWAMFDDENRPDWRSLWPRDDDGGGGGGGSGPDEPQPGRGGGGGPELLPESRPPRVRLREHGRLADAFARERRPGHVPEPARAPERVDG